MSDDDAWTSVQKGYFSSISAGDSFNLNDMTGFDGTYTCGCIVVLLLFVKYLITELMMHLSTATFHYANIDFFNLIRKSVTIKKHVKDLTLF